MRDGGREGIELPEGTRLRMGEEALHRMFRGHMRHVLHTGSAQEICDHLQLCQGREGRDKQVLGIYATVDVGQAYIHTCTYMYISTAQLHTCSINIAGVLIYLYFVGGVYNTTNSRASNDTAHYLYT